MRSLRASARRSKYDGLWRRWELFDALTLGEVTKEELKWQAQRHPTARTVVNGRRWVCTGVFQTRREALA